MGGVEYQVTKVDPTDPETKGMVYQVHKVSEEVAATLGGKVYRARIINDPTDPTVAGKVYQIVLIGDPEDPAVKGKVYNAILTGGSEAVIVGPAVSPLVLPDAIANSLSYVKAFGGTEQRNLPDGYIERQFIYMMDNSYLVPSITPEPDWHIEMDFQTTAISTAGVRNYFGSRYANSPIGAGIRLAHTASGYLVLYGFDTTNPYTGSGASYKMAGNTRYKYVYNNNSASLSTGGTVVDSTTFTVNDPTTREVAINSYSSSDTWSTTSEGIYLYSFKAWNGQGELVMDLVPAVQKGTVPVVGFYDTVSGTFKTATAGTFAAGSEAVPTPDAPIDIVSNNGALKARHQSGLPLGYTLLDFVTNASGTRINTGIYDDIDDFSIEIRVKPSGGSWYICQSRANSGAPIYGLSGGLSGARIAMGIGLSGGSASSDISRDTSHIYTVIGSHKNGVTTIYVKDETTGDEDTQTTTYDTNDFTAAPTTIGVWGQSSNTVNANNDIYYLKIRKGGELVADYVPCQYNGENGFYDFVSQRFFGATVGTINAGNPVSDPMEIYADGTVETINAHGKNLFNQALFDTDVASTITYTTFEISNGTYTMSTNFPYAGGATNVFVFAGEVTSGAATITNGVYDGQSRTITVTNGKYTVAYRSRTSASSNTNNPKDYDFQLELGSTATAYQPYYDGGTATAEMLLKVGDYQDEQEILSGAVTRNVGVKVLDGTEDGWSKGNNSFGNSALFADKKREKSIVFCSHFQYDTGSTSSILDGCVGCASTSANTYFRNDALSTIEDWTQWLADQYAAGTPVIVVYPLRTPTTESVTGQTLQVTGGDNVLEITQASLTGLELEAQYNAAVSLTIQEVQDANLDPNVQVTII